ncbi:MAG: GAF domain-containing protein, partial [Erysipelotrichaceae bacterium]|nr:GAF domain-containing protein [Erysipelotrichaceae bacterium]
MSDPRFVTCAWQIMDELSHSNQLESSLEACLEILTRTMKCKSGCIWMANSTDHRYYIVANIGETDNCGISVGESDSFVSQVIENQDTSIVQDCQNDPRIVSDKSFSALFGDNAILVPLKTPYGIIGCLQLNDKQGNFNKDDE